ncbi:uncharacterized protein AMSG_02473 [Thecamonas trahens ATCC 50062]|uniref:Uncharacterized protein n=1 Tax=Thecamonas trahens ATCC 50062 TaxID=461836 RepID=A0A0L0D5U0_THETB|nr:hypothetical protein AMSG_02473 [Thecamonas trahens ATCC 50062]KNC47456.1 hypothetical protein AMSG_02473 [Thecamonas trahens ATCC 50062]|eukprot:XP_013759392.1 hypothetical protein AMSG_02473 [Thecamonas trahens ATCC 50062]
MEFERFIPSHKSGLDPGAIEALVDKYRGSPLHKPLPLGSEDTFNSQSGEPPWRKWEGGQGKRSSGAGSATIHAKSVVCAAFNTHASVVFTGSEDETVKVWDISSTTTQLVATYDGHTGTVTDLLYVDGLKKLFSASLGGEIIVWHYAQTQKALKFLSMAAPPAPAHSLPIAQYLRSSSRFDELKVKLRTATEKIERAEAVGGALAARVKAQAVADRNAAAAELGALRAKLAPAIDRPEPVFCLAWLPGDDVLVAVFKDALRLYSYNRSDGVHSDWHEVLPRVGGRGAGGPSGAGIGSSASRQAALLALDMTNMTKPRRARRNPSAEMRGTRHMVYMPYAHLLVTATDSGALCGWVFSQQKKALVLKVHREDAHELGITALAASMGADGWLASGSHDRAIRVWSYVAPPASEPNEYGSLILVHTFRSHAASITGLTFVNSTATLWASAGSDEPIIYDLATFTDVTSVLATLLPGKGSGGTGASGASERGESEAAAARGGGGGGVGGSVEEEAGAALALGRMYYFEAVDKVLAVTNRRQLVVWKYRYGAALTTLVQHSDVVDALSFSRTNPLVFFSAGADGRIVQWEREQSNTYKYNKEELWIEGKPDEMARAGSALGAPGCAPRLIASFAGASQTQIDDWLWLTEPVTTDGHEAGEPEPDPFLLDDDDPAARRAKLAARQTARKRAHIASQRKAQSSAKASLVRGRGSSSVHGNVASTWSKLSAEKRERARALAKRNRSLYDPSRRLGDLDSPETAAKTRASPQPTATPPAVQPNPLIRDGVFVTDPMLFNAVHKSTGGLPDLVRAGSSQGTMSSLLQNALSTRSSMASLCESEVSSSDSGSSDDGESLASISMDDGGRTTVLSVADKLKVRLKEGRGGRGRSASLRSFAASRGNPQAKALGFRKRKDGRASAAEADPVVRLGLVASPLKPADAASSVKFRKSRLSIDVVLYSDELDVLLLGTSRGRILVYGYRDSSVSMTTVAVPSSINYERAQSMPQVGANIRSRLTGLSLLKSLPLVGSRGEGHTDAITGLEVVKVESFEYGNDLSEHRRRRNADLGSGPSGEGRSSYVLVSVARDATLRVWQLDTGEEVLYRKTTLLGTTDADVVPERVRSGRRDFRRAADAPITTLAWCERHRVMAWGDEVGMVWIKSFAHAGTLGHAGMVLVQALSEHVGTITALEWNVVHSAWMSASVDGTLKLWGKGIRKPKKKRKRKRLSTLLTAAYADDELETGGGGGSDRTSGNGDGDGCESGRGRGRGAATPVGVSIIVDSTDSDDELVQVRSDSNDDSESLDSRDDDDGVSGSGTGGGGSGGESGSALGSSAVSVLNRSATSVRFDTLRGEGKPRLKRMHTFADPSDRTGARFGATGSAMGGHTSLDTVEFGSIVRCVTHHCGPQGISESSRIRVAAKQTRGMVVAGTDEGKIFVYNPVRREVVASLFGHADLVKCVVYLPQRHQYVSGSWDNTLKVWAAYTRDDKPSQNRFGGRPGKASSRETSRPRSQTVVAASEDGGGYGVGRPVVALPSQDNATRNAAVFHIDPDLRRVVKSVAGDSGVGGGFVPRAIDDPEFVSAVRELEREEREKDDGLLGLVPGSRVRFRDLNASMASLSTSLNGMSATLLSPLADSDGERPPSTPGSEEPEPGRGRKNNRSRLARRRLIAGKTAARKHAFFRADQAADTPLPPAHKIDSLKY